MNKVSAEFADTLQRAVTEYRRAETALRFGNNDHRQAHAAAYILARQKLHQTQREGECELHGHEVEYMVANERGHTPCRRCYRDIHRTGPRRGQVAA